MSMSCWSSGRKSSSSDVEFVLFLLGAILFTAKLVGAFSNCFYLMPLRTSLFDSRNSFCCSFLRRSFLRTSAR